MKSHGQRLGGSWACLPPVYKCNHPATVCDTCGIHPKQHTKKRGALRNIKMTKITRRARTWGRSVWKRPKRKHSEWKEPPLEGTSHHRWNNSAERPWGSWACLPPVYHWVWNHPATGCDMCTTPEKHTKKRETLRNAHQNKTTRRAPPPPPPPRPKGSIQN